MGGLHIYMRLFCRKFCASSRLDLVLSSTLRERGLEISLLLGALDWTTSTRLSTSVIFDFEISDVSRALVLHVGFRQRR